MGLGTQPTHPSQTITFLFYVLFHITTVSRVSIHSACFRSLCLARNPPGLWCRNLVAESQSNHRLRPCGVSRSHRMLLMVSTGSLIGGLDLSLYSLFDQRRGIRGIACMVAGPMPSFIVHFRSYFVENSAALLQSRERSVLTYTRYMLRTNEYLLPGEPDNRILLR